MKERFYGIIQLAFQLSHIFLDLVMVYLSLHNILDVPIAPIGDLAVSQRMGDASGLTALEAAGLQGKHFLLLWDKPKLTVLLLKQF